MKRKITLLVLALCATVTVNAQKTAKDAKPGTVIIKGKIGNIHPPAQLWIYMGTEKWDTIPVKNGVFEYQKSTLLPAYGAIMVKYKPYYPDQKGNPPFFSNMSLMSMFFEDGTSTVHTDTDTISTRTVVEGSELQRRYREYWNKEGVIVKEQKKLAMEFNNSTPEQLQSETYQRDYEKKNEVFLVRLDSLIKAELKAYPNSYHTVMAFGGYKRVREPDSATAMTIVNGFGSMYLESMRTATLEGIKQKNEKPVVIENGAMAPDFTQRDIHGKPFQLSQLRGKFVLVDFWASWCGPCRKVNPDLVKLYDQFKGNTFEIVGVSLDDNDAKWKEAVAKDGLAWLHTSDLKGWKNAVAAQYGIRAVPQNFLLDPSGKVIAKNLKIKQLTDELAKLLKVQ